MTDYAYLARGKLFVCLAGEEPRELTSPFAESVAARSAQIAKRSSWKRTGRGARFMMGLGVEDIPDEALDPTPRVAPVLFSGISRGRYEAEIIYSLTTGAISGLFAFAGGEEARLCHGADHKLSEPACAPDGSRIACVVSEQGLSHLAIVRGDGSRVQQVTEGDAAERSPSWVPGTGAVVFESQAFGYDSAGVVVDMAPAVVQRLDIEKGEIVTLAEDPNADCTSPRMDANGTLYFVKRARAPRASVPLSRLLVDLLLFPFRLLRALLSYLNIFSIRYSGKSLVSPGAARQKPADLRRMIVAGNVLNAQARSEEEAEKEREKVRLGWQLVARAKDGTERKIAKRVLAYDVCGDGRILYTTGEALFLVEPGGKETKLRAEEGLTDVIALPSAPA